LLGGANLTLEDYYEHSNRIEAKAMPHVVSWIQSHFRFRLVEDVREHPFYQSMEVDLIMEDLDRVLPNPLFVEVKVRGKFWRDIAIETVKNVEQNKPGWIWTSKAFLLAYVYYVEDKLHPNRYLIHLPGLKRWFEKNQHRYRPILAPNPPWKPVYHTEFYRVPPEDIPDNLFLLRP